MTISPHDRQRPIYHFMPRRNWMNDPNGLIQWQGVYHIFYQHNPNAAVWGDMHWGHATSTDLVHWHHEPIALAPTPDSPDADGCWSGVIVNDHGKPTMIYSGHQLREGHSPHIQLPCRAISNDNLQSWEKDPANPLFLPPKELDILAFRDHCIWRTADRWMQVIGAGIKDQGGAVLLYQSANLRHWEYLGPICIGDRQETGDIWECPDFFAIDGQHALIISPIPLRRVIGLTGSFDGRVFRPHTRYEIDAGGCLYAPQSFVDEQGRRIMIGWLWEERPEADCVSAGWAGVFSLPRQISLRPDGRLAFSPVPELEVLRERALCVSRHELPADTMLELLADADDALELSIELDIGDARQIILMLRRSPDGEEQTQIIYDCKQARLLINRERSCHLEGPERRLVDDECPLDDDGLLRLRVFLDRSVLEIYTGSGICLTSRIYPERDDSRGIALLACGGSARLLQLKAWSMRAAL